MKSKQKVSKDQPTEHYEAAYVFADNHTDRDTIKYFTQRSAKLQAKRRFYANKLNSKGAQRIVAVFIERVDHVTQQVTRVARFDTEIEQWENL